MCQTCFCTPKRPCFLYSLGDGVDKDRVRKHGREKYTFPSCYEIHPPLLSSLHSFLPLFRFLWKMCVEFGKTRRREGGGRWEGDLKGIALSQLILPFRTSPPPLSSSPLVCLPQRGTRRGQRCPFTLLPFFLFFSLPLLPLSGTGRKKNLSPSSLVSYVVPSLPWCAGGRKRKKLQYIKKGYKSRKRAGSTEFLDFFVCPVFLSENRHGRQEYTLAACF